jgi:hypothetical protein
MSEEKIYIYPQNSCKCCRRDTSGEFIEKPQHIIKSALCYSSTPYFQCNSVYKLNTKVEPTCNSKIITINKNKPLNFASDFEKITCGKCEDGCPCETYISRDPKLRNGMRGFALKLDRPPSDSSIKLSTIYDDKLKGYGQNYKSYSDINAGDITYYVDRSVERGTLYEPVFGTRATNTGYIYKNPMDNMEYVFDRAPLSDRCPTTTTSCKPEQSCLSFISDTEKHRQDLLSRQFRIRDRNSRTRV